ncbi:carbon starvation protein A [Actinobacteria bacterium YIM 96077]|uniref:Carbon starvation protein A n=1 Tax=Phytoactinopolyspora halophila TaxID=1981511 RepID=A0A329R2F8_9ACTN|nr:carbon starvation protein A [Phytoactinopolyspora halophila]AYY15179.1 carbon starvation protein A [Actinobacteria bacterium YIM 96077]RAW18149.1 carbon starvation protein A [Phytoactinopolyspora halophila]
MPAVAVAAAVLALFAFGYVYYSRYLATKVYALDPAFVTPAHELADGVDFVPTNKHVLFGHHFTSIAGAAPIVGPAIAVFWGWLPALLWITIGTLFAAGVHDFGALAVSVRHKAKNIGTLTAEVISARSRVLFLCIIFFLLTLVNAVFAVVIGNLFVLFPGAVIPVFVEIPLAIAIGQYIYRTRTPALVPSLIGVIGLYFLIWVGHHYPIEITGFADWLGMEPRDVWVVIMFAYTFIASRLPVWLLLQPRDYINSHQLFIALAVTFAGVLVGWDKLVAPAVRGDVPDDSPNIFPFLFITIACGAISGFHSLVSSGTTSKQLDKETDARHVGYMGALGEGSLALASVLAVSAGVAATQVEWEETYATYADASDGATGNFVNGIAQFASNLGIEFTLGTVFAAVVVVSFAATTMDTGVRLQRYIVQEIATILGWRRLSRSLTLAGLAAIALPVFLALMPGRSDAGFAFGTLWRLFGTTNQLTAGLAMAVVAVWVTKRMRNPIAILIPMVFLLVMTTWALFVQLGEFWESPERWVLVPLDVIILFLALWLIVEAAIALRRTVAERRGATIGGSGDSGSAGVDTGSGASGEVSGSETSGDGTA